MPISMPSIHVRNSAFLPSAARALTCWLSLCVVLGFGPVASAQQHDDSSEYRRAIDAALQEYNAGNFAEAQALFERAHVIRPSARTLRGLGMTYFELKKYVRARETLQAALDDARQPLTAAQRREAQELLERTATYIGTLRVHATPETASVLLNGEPIEGEISLELGEYELTLRAPGHRDLNRQVSIEGGKQRTLTLALVPLEIGAAQAARVQTPNESAAPQALAQQPAERDSSNVLEQWWFWTAAGAIVAGGVISAVVLTSHSRTESLVPGDAGIAVALRRGP
jgi:tetratricopeptide (TPR) repeat protein